VSTLDTYCATEGAFLRKILRLPSRPIAVSIGKPDGTGIREPFGGTETGGGVLEDAKGSMRAVEELLAERGRFEDPSLTLFPLWTLFSGILSAEKLATYADGDVVRLFRDTSGEFALGS
jgi:hypothetical protein